jgi:glycosyltransferase involved in cell wall biosynthesis
MENKPRKRILFVCGNPPHPLHVSFAKRIGADFFRYPKEDQSESLKTLKKIPRDYDIYFTEGFLNYVSLLKLFKRLKKSAKIINLFSDPRLFQIFSGKKFNPKRSKVKKYPFIQEQIVKRNIRNLDGAFCIGDFSASLFRKYNKKSPMINVPAFVFKKKAKSLLKITPKLSNKNILFIAQGPDFHYKGLDLLIDVFREIKKSIPEAKLHILGKWNVRKEWQSKDIYFEGYQDVQPYLKNSALSLHLGRGEAFGINVIETMLAGIPTIVSNYTGAKEVVRKADESLVVPLNKKIIVERILEYFELDPKKKKKLSEACRKAAKLYDEDKLLEDFEEKFEKLLEEIENKKK